MNNLELIEEYKKFITFEKRLSPASIKSYLRDIDELLKLDKNKELNSYKLENIRKNIAILHSKGLGGKSLSRMISSWRGLFSFLIHHFIYEGHHWWLSEEKTVKMQNSEKFVTG